jgi:hypothetical protein
MSSRLLVRSRPSELEHGPSKPNAFGSPHTEANQSAPIALSESQMCALLAASYPLPPRSRGPFLEACAREIANLPELGDGVLHRTIVRVQRMYFDPPFFSIPPTLPKFNCVPGSRAKWPFITTDPKIAVLNRVRSA